jgi:hypothetical protein
MKEALKDNFIKMTISLLLIELDFNKFDCDKSKARNHLALYLKAAEKCRNGGSAGNFFSENDIVSVAISNKLNAGIALYRFSCVESNAETLDTQFLGLLEKIANM